MKIISKTLTKCMTVAVLTLYSATSFALTCPSGSTLVGGTGADQKGAKCVPNAAANSKNKTAKESKTQSNKGTENKSKTESKTESKPTPKS